MNLSEDVNIISYVILRLSFKIYYKIAVLNENLILILNICLRNNRTIINYMVRLILLL